MTVIDHFRRDGLHSVSTLRSERLQWLRRRARELRPATEELLATLPPSTQAVLRAASSSGVHICLLRECLALIGWHDQSVIGALITGFPLVGHVPSDTLTPVATVRSITRSSADLLRDGPTLRQRAYKRSTTRASSSTVGAFSPDQVTSQISSQTRDDIDAGRIGPSREAASNLHHHRPLTRRFGVEQSTSTGKPKIRCIDDFLASLVNGATSVYHRIRMDGIPMLLLLLSTLMTIIPSATVLLCKSDFSAAYRSLPILTAHLAFSDILFYDSKLQGWRIATQFAMPFGAVAAVYAWDRIGAAVTAILRHLFCFPLLRYVDDLFGLLLGDNPQQDRSDLLEVVDLLGLRLDPDKTPSPSSSMTILGVLITIVYINHLYYAQLDIDPRKQQVWLQALREALHTRTLHPYDAEVLAGRLEFAATAVLGKGHRHRIRTIYNHARSYHHDITDDQFLLTDLHWWSRLLASPLPRRRVQLTGDRPPPLLLYTDAEGGGGIGAALFAHASASPLHWLSSRTPQWFFTQLLDRRTQIVPLEALAVVAALLTWSSLLRHQRVIIMVDNVSVVGALRKGSSTKRDINLIVGTTHMLLADLDIDLFVHWVPSKYNVADLPSRGRPPAIAGGAITDVNWTSVFSSIY